MAKLVTFSFPLMLTSLLKLSKYSPLELIDTIVSQHRTKMSKQTSESISSLDESNISKLDTIAAYTILRLMSKVPSPSNGWGHGPKNNQVRVGDDIERIRYLRNKFLHRRSTKVPRNEFMSFFTEVKYIAKRFDILCKAKGMFEQDIETIQFSRIHKMSYDRFIDEAHGIVNSIIGK
ncbi:unnamed protein product [Mytilus coruscus]|uniref:DZIP3-like HEPN domain-containing protein n=1 Tax=Mytilus coruscus TaxID=42192 RepID=A0A6J8EUD7_MYTCO|nr:unnamed protein product [Mytilus coruscus]